MAVLLKTASEIEALRNASCLLASILDKLQLLVTPGRTPRQLSDRFVTLVRQAGAVPIFQGYQRNIESRPYPSPLCVSVSPVVTHGVPDERLLRAGDVVNLDAGLALHGWCADTARCVVVQPGDAAADRVAIAAQSVLHAAIAAIRPGCLWGTVRACAIAESHRRGVQIVPDVAGHGIGRRLHEAPSLPLELSAPSNIDELVLVEGMTLAIEPVVSSGGVRLARHHDGFGTVLADGSIGAHCEECIAVVSGGASLLSRR